jgi:RNA polymerase sigma factor (sigma-70 family)
MTKNHPDAEDLAFDTVTKTLKIKDSLQGPASFRGRLFRILTNKFISNCRKQRNRPELGIAASATDSDSNEFLLFDRLHQPFLLFWGSSPEQEFLNNVLRKDLCRALDLPRDEYRVVVLLSNVEGFSCPEIAEIPEIPVGTVRSRLSRARSRLQLLPARRYRPEHISAHPFHYAREKPARLPGASARNLPGTAVPGPGTVHVLYLLVATDRHGGHGVVQLLLPGSRDVADAMNKTRHCSMALLKRTFLSAPVLGNILQWLPAEPTA